MSTEYYASFEPVPQTREELLDALLHTLSEMGARVDLDFDQLALEDGRFVYTFERASFRSFEQAIRATKGWDGIEAHFSYKDRACSLLIWNDIPGHTTVVFQESGVLFAQQRVNVEGRKTLIALLWRFMTRLEASFCVFEPGTTFRSRTRADIELWLEYVRQGTPKDWCLVIVKDEYLPPGAVPQLDNVFYHSKTKKAWLLSWIGEVSLDPPWMPEG